LNHKGQRQLPLPFVMFASYLTQGVAPPADFDCGTCLTTENEQSGLTLFTNRFARIQWQIANCLFAALPLDVREVYDLPSVAPCFEGLRPHLIPTPTSIA
jgi:hypothetical protein